ncbi:dTDP-4-dehydrorhamnose 3,5-epimerase [Thermotomaculum hydrothermale]|uniref:dTDP-4-dehydrorhamnose 3,5-epimerase n=1 Tax=Thermotomaculum hydrothermale TaxID=981385 RepID=A0A7R6SY03_9BACT|nr:dTDP-4-dehydrorhamnose 3,5-epimerase [Thermotomaculum hydrothermale]BBB32264.1 dTDP-4-dehydrorhamnose 3,5-epimerase [Thermotomaculum hydrothermale]
MGFKFKRLEISDLILITPDRYNDYRGFFQEVYKESVFKESGIKDDFYQLNMSYSKKGVIRGLHYQLPPKPQAKLVRCVYGEIFDVAVDVRKSSRTFKKWVGVALSHKNGEMLYIPEGFAHGFAVLSDFAIVEYFVSNEYCPECEGGVVYNSPELSINWPVENPIVSEKDLSLPDFNKAWLFD